MKQQWINCFLLNGSFPTLLQSYRSLNHRCEVPPQHKSQHYIPSGHCRALVRNLFSRMRTHPRFQTRSPHVVRIATALSKVMAKWISTTGTQVPQTNSNANHVVGVSAGPVLLLVTTGIVYIAQQCVQARDEAGKYTFWDNQIGNDWRQCILVLL